MQGTTQQDDNVTEFVYVFAWELIVVTCVCFWRVFRRSVTVYFTDQDAVSQHAWENFDQILGGSST